MTAEPALLEYLTTTKIGEKGQLTMRKEFRDDLGLPLGAPFAVSADWRRTDSVTRAAAFQAALAKSRSRFVRGLGSDGPPTGKFAGGARTGICAALPGVGPTPPPFATANG